ncbi:MAG: hypothetical protein JWM40_1077 [Frankiales bacterium]|nr:hypothetical protein [Frankiales bacterium]
MEPTPNAVVGLTPAPPQKPAPARKTSARPPAERSEQHAHLTLDALRAYRKALTAEESNVSYWRRIIQARLDLVLAGSLVTSDNLRPVLTDERIGAGRQALIEILPVDDIPPLPDLASLWDRYVDPDDAAGIGVLANELADAEKQLSEYRSVLHQRLSAATGELIARYRDEPTLCLSALPMQPVRRALQQPAPLRSV